MSEGTTKVQLDKRACKLPTKAASEVTDEGNREERASTGVKAQQKPTCKKGINNDVLSSSSKDNLLSQGRKPKGCVVIFFNLQSKTIQVSWHHSMGYTDLKKRHDELVLEAQLFESRAKEMERQHVDTVNKLLLEIQQWKVNRRLHGCSQTLPNSRKTH